MPTSAYFITLQTRDEFTAPEYGQATGHLTNVLHATLGDPTKLRSLMHATEITDPRVEVDISQSQPSETAQITARCVVQADAPSKLSFDKSLFTSMVRAELPFPVTVSKRAVSKDEQAMADSLADVPPPEEPA